MMGGEGRENLLQGLGGINAPDLLQWSKSPRKKWARIGMFKLHSMWADCFTLELQK